MLGTKTDPDLLVDADLYAGNKVLVNTGTIALYGKVPTTITTRLSASASSGSKTITVLAASDWAVGDQLVISPSEFGIAESEYVKIAAISGTTITLEQNLSYFHYGSASTT